jgi:general secretion pathway protein I
MAHDDRGSRAAGFTLLEILVALVIFALLFGVLAQIFQTGLRQATVAEAASAATALARAQLARVGVEVPLASGEIGGESEGGLSWRTVIEQQATPATGDEVPEDLVPYLVEVTVAWGPGASERVTLTTLRVGPPPQ